MRRNIVLFLSLLFLLIFLNFIILYQKRVFLYKKISKPNTIPSVLKEKENIKTNQIIKKATLDFNLENFNNNSEVKLKVIANSEEPISGFDIIINYNPQNLIVKEIKSENPDFDIKSFKKNNFIIITGYKKLSITQQIRFLDTPLFYITFFSLKKGNENFQIQPVEKIGNEETFFVSENTQKIYPKLNPVKFKIN